MYDDTSPLIQKFGPSPTNTFIDVDGREMSTWDTCALPQWVKETWLAALRADVPKIEGDLCDEDGGHCALGVLGMALASHLDDEVEAGGGPVGLGRYDGWVWGPTSRLLTDKQRTLGFVRVVRAKDGSRYIRTGEVRSNYLPDVFREEWGIPQRFEVCIGTLNDGVPSLYEERYEQGSLSFGEIADLIEKNVRAVTEP